MSARRLEDYGLIGDCETAALVGADGSIDWLCWPAFDSDACFAALLGGPQHGAWRIAPTVGEGRASHRRYLPDTLVLESRFETSEGAATVTDFMPIRSETSHLVRLVRGERGRLEMTSSLRLRFGYGRLRPWVLEAKGLVRAAAGPDAVLFATERPGRFEQGEWRSSFEVAAGETVGYSLSYHASHRPPPAPPDTRALLAETTDRWRAWIRRCAYDGPWGEAVRRSLLTLKALTFRPTGGLVAAPTSSLPEARGGGRNWDYRFCWLRDATFTLLALLQAGYSDEAAAWRDWLLRAAAGDADQLQPLYTLTGRRRIMEWTADWLPGFNGARPVRFGNAASAQHQLDTFGEVVDALYQAERNGVAMSPSEHDLQATLVEHVARVWRQPDRGIWEVRGRPQRFTHSQAMAWVALDRGVKAAERFGLRGPLETWRRLRDEMHAEICREAWDPRKKAFTQALGSDVLDGSVLLLPHIGFLPARDPRMVSTVDAIRRELLWEGLVRRYPPHETDDGLDEPEGVFLACSFWLAENLILQGRRDEGAALFGRLLGLRNELGLLSEEYDPRSRRLLGNFPQALSHLALVNTALSLSGRGPAQVRGERDPDEVTS